MLLDELQQHVSERYFSHYINPSLLSAIYAATGRKMGASDSMGYDDNDDGRAKRKENDDYQNDRRRQQQQQHGQSGKNHAYAEEIDDNIDYGSVDD